MPECRQVKNIIPSIAYQLACFSLPFRHALERVFRLNPDVRTRVMRVQYEKLVVEPLMGVQSCLPVDFIVVIDALDECENEDSVSQILDLFLSTAYTIPIRFLISSRPEIEIARKMEGQPDRHGGVRLVLHELESNMVKADIGRYMREELKDIPLSDEKWRSLIDRCGLLFAYASTTCRYIRNAYETKTLDEALNTMANVASMLMEHGDMCVIDGHYKATLDRAFGHSGMNPADKQRMKEALDTVIHSIEPMTLSTMAELLRLRNVEQAGALLLPLQSVLNVNKENGIVTILHESFRGFMLSSRRSAPHHCQSPFGHIAMAEACLRTISTNYAKFNICALHSSYLLDNEVEDPEKRISELIPPGLMYACRCWATHLKLGGLRPELIDRVGDFFSSKLLLWMEVMNLTKHMAYGAGIIQDVEKWCIVSGARLFFRRFDTTSIQEHEAPEDLAVLAHDASHFVSVFANHPVSRSTPHIYMSMLAFWPRSRPISAAYIPRISGLVRPTGTAIDRRQMALIATWKVSTRSVGSMGLTADGGRLVAPSEKSIEVYDTTTGESVLNLTDERAESVDYVAISPDGTSVVFSREYGIAYVWDTRNERTVTQLLPDDVSGVLSLAFSCDGSRVACGLRNGEVYICGIQQEASSVVRLTGHTGYVKSVVFSSDRLHLASGSDDNTVRVWDVRTGQPVGEPLEGHTDSVFSVSYSDDGSRLASASRDNTIRAWDLQTGQMVLGTFTGHTNSVLSVSFSPDGAIIASGSWDNTIRACGAHTGHTVLGPLHGHTDAVNHVTYSSDGTRLYSCSNDGTVRIWDAQSRDAHDDPPPVQALLGPIYSIRYSHGGSRVASGLHDGTARVWDGHTGELLLGPLRGHDNPVVSLDYSPDDKYIATASYDSTLRIWDASTGNDMRGPMHGHSGYVNHVRFSPDGSLIATGSSDGTVRVWDVSTSQQLVELYSGKGAILSPPQLGSFSRVPSDGTHLVSGSDDKSVGIWDAKTGKELFVCGECNGSHSPHSNIVLSVSFSPDGRYVASGSSDRAVRVWDARNGRLILGPLMGHTGWVRCVQFSPDGSHVISCSSDGTIRFWDVSSCRLNSQEATMSTDGSEMDEIGSLGRNGLSSFSLNDDGWLFDSQGRRLLWVPSDLRDSLIHPPTDLLIGDRDFMKLDFDGAKLGDLWADCYRP
ncbi:unnamed protein product [Rhizoctonia solani]|uniref:Nephrocystin 3-like N-terminal domain-containing protein n=2 Tax=Rhizoctonia solani TaxID=456999 RepID=A0A8H3A8M3_9AGAM|nr:unnamed protein product [Rhizoctonia solani]